MQLNEPGKQIQDITPDWASGNEAKRGDILANPRFQRSQLWQLALGSQLRRPKPLSAVRNIYRCVLKHRHTDGREMPQKHIKDPGHAFAHTRGDLGL